MVLGETLLRLPLPPREFIQALQRKFISGKLRDQLANFSAEDPFELVEQIAQYTGSRSVENEKHLIQPQDLQEAAHDFHAKAWTLTEEVKREIDKLGSKDTLRLRIFHQPNLFMSPKILQQAKALNDVASGLKSRYDLNSAQLWLALDYDDCSDPRFRTRQIRDPFTREQIIFTGAVSRSEFGKVMWSIDKPGEGLVHKWINQLRGIQDRHRGYLSKRIHHDQLLALRHASQKSISGTEGLIQNALENSDTLVEFNMILMSYQVNLNWRLPTLFIPAHQLQPGMTKAYEYLISRLPAIKTASKQAVARLKDQVVIQHMTEFTQDAFPVWYVCEHCDERVKLFENESDNLTVSGECQRCQTKYQFNLGTKNEPNLDPIKNRMLPNVILDDLLETLGLGLDGGYDYIGSAEHMLISNLVARELGISPQPPHGFHWFSDVFYDRALL